MLIKNALALFSLIICVKVFLLTLD